MLGRWEAVTPSHVVEITVLELAKLNDDLKTIAGPATSRLLDTLAVYRDSRPEDR